MGKRVDALEVAEVHDVAAALRGVADDGDLAGKVPFGDWRQRRPPQSAPFLLVKGKGWGRKFMAAFQEFSASATFPVVLLVREEKRLTELRLPPRMSRTSAL